MKNNYSTLHLDVASGQSGGKILWQPRIGCWYDDKLFEDGGLPAPFTGMDLPQIYRELNCSARIYDYNPCIKRVEHPSVKYETQQLNSTDTKLTVITPAGNQTIVQRKISSSYHPMLLKREVETEDELKVAIWLEENVEWQWDQQTYDSVKNKWGNLGAPTIHMPRMNIQSLYIEKMGTEKGIYAIYDWPDTIEAYFNTLDESHRRYIDVVNDSPIKIINFGENVHAGTLSPNLFVKYHLPACQARCEHLHRADKFVHSHWDGDTKPLLQYAQETQLDGIEAITPKPQGDVTLEEIKDALGDSMFLIDGIPAILFDETYPVSMLREYVYRLIDLFAPKLILGISDEISSTGDLDRIRVVGKIVDEYNKKQEK